MDKRMKGKVAAVILAAGRSTRMGTHKLLLPLGGRPLVSYAVSAALSSTASPVVVVLGHDAERVRHALPAGDVRIVVNGRYAEGMASSLATGIGAIATSSTPVAGAIVLLADQPLVTAEMIDGMIGTVAADPTRIVVTSYGGRRGQPVFFPSALFGELQAIEGDEGGRSVLARHPDLIETVAIEPAEIGLDVDEPSVYERLSADWPRYSGRFVL